MLKTKMNKLITRYQKAQSKRFINKIQFEIELEEQIKQNRLAFRKR